MLDNIFLGREITQKTFDNIKNILSSLLDKDSKDEFIVDLNVIEDELLLTLDNEIYTIFQIKIFEVFNNILLKYGIFVTGEINFSVYEKVFYTLFSIKYVDYNKEELSIILYGDFQNEDKLNLIFSLFFEETSDILETIDITDFFFEFIEDNIKEEKTYNIEMMERAIKINKECDNIFIDSLLYLEVIKGEVIFDLDINKDEKIILQELINRTSTINNKENKIKEIVFGLMFYNVDNLINIKTYITDEILNLTFDEINDKNSIKENILNLIDKYKRD